MTTNTILTVKQRESFKAQFLANGTRPHLTAAELSISLQTEQAVLQSAEVQRLREDAERLDILERDAGYFVFSVGRSWRTRPKPAQPGELGEIAPKHSSLRNAIDAIAEKYR